MLLFRAQMRASSALFLALLVTSCSDNKAIGHAAPRNAPAEKKNFFEADERGTDTDKKLRSRILYNVDLVWGLDYFRS